MSADLISRKALINILKDVEQDGLLKICQIIELLEDQPKAYEDTGLTPDQIVELKERDTAKEPQFEGDGYADGEMVYDEWICPNCGEYYEVDYDDYDFCPKCGQRILRQED